MTIIPNIIPTGVIDGVNKIFTLPKEASEMVDVIFDGIEYFDYSLSGVTLTLQDAPTLSLRVDFYPVGTTGEGFSGEGIAVSEARTLLEQALDYDNMGDVSDAVFLTWCQEADDLFYPILRRLNSYKYYTPFPITTAVSQQNYSLPDDFLNIADPKTGIYLASDTGNISEIVLSETGLGSTSEGYYLQGGDIYFTPIPGVIKKYILIYMAQLVRLVNSTSKLTIETQYTQALTNFLKKKFYLWDRNPGDASLADQEFANDLNMMQTNARTSTRSERVKNNNNIY